MPSEPDVTMPGERPRRHGCLWIALALVVALIGTYAWYLISSGNEVEAELAAIRAAGYPTSAAELNAWYALPEGTENAAPAWLAACGALSEKLDTDAEPLVPYVGMGTWPEDHAPIPEGMRGAITAYLAKNSDALAQLHAAARNSSARYPADLSLGPNAILSHLSPLRAAARLLALDAVWQAQAGRTDVAVQDVRTALALGDSLRREPMLISQLVRIAVAAIAIRSLEDGMNRAAFSEAQCVDLQKALAAADDPQLMATGLVGERAMGVSLMEQMTAGQAGPQPAGKGFARWAWRVTGLEQKNLLTTVQMETEMINAARLPYAQARAESDRLDREIAQLPPTQFLARMTLPALARCYVEGAMYGVRLSLARAALALERHRIAHGALPESLDALVPAYLDAVPIDPFDGNLLRYTRTEKGFTVYSIGIDRKDDGGARRSPDKLTWDEVFSVEREEPAAKP